MKVTKLVEKGSKHSCGKVCRRNILLTTGKWHHPKATHHAWNQDENARQYFFQQRFISIKLIIMFSPVKKTVDTTEQMSLRQTYIHFYGCFTDTQATVNLSFLRCIAIVKGHCSKHRPHSYHVTGALCTEVAARRSWAEYSSRPTTDSRHLGWAINDVFRFSELCSICEQPLYGTILMILHTNKSCILISDQTSIWKIPKALGHSRGLFTSCRRCP